MRASPLGLAAFITESDMARLGIDFGTSNTAAGVLVGGRPYVIPLEAGAQTLPSAVFMDFADQKFLYGSSAARAMMDGQDGRFMRALKSVLGTPLAREPRQFMGQRLTLLQILARFLAEIKTRAQTHTGLVFDQAVSGRPVRFHSSDAAKDQQALLDLQEAYALAGFDAVEFVPEPEAAALAVNGQGMVLIVDIGGGTSDFTLCERSSSGTRVLASKGVRIGGTDFDKALSLKGAMPLLGYEAMLKDPLGSRYYPAPRSLFHDLASWEKIAFMYDPVTLRDVNNWIRMAQDPDKFVRLAQVLESHLGHDIAYAVEAGKIAVNSGHPGTIDLGVIERDLSAELKSDVVDQCLSDFATQIGHAALETIAVAGGEKEQVDTIVLVGGSSQMGIVQSSLATCFPKVPQETAEVFTAVVHGLAHIAGEAR